MDEIKRLSEDVIARTGGKENIISAFSCMTRLRISVKDDRAVREAELKELDGVLGVFRPREGCVEVVVGPGKSTKCMDVFRAYGIQASADTQNAEPDKNLRKTDRIRKITGVFPKIFAPMIPGIVTAGIFAGIVSLITQLVPGYADMRVLSVLIRLLSGVSAAFIAFISAWAGYRAAEVFGGTPVLGGMLGLFMTADRIGGIENSIFGRTGSGGILAVLAGVWLMCRIETFLRKKMPDALSPAAVPPVTLLAALIPCVFVIGPVLGYLSAGICRVIGYISMDAGPLVRLAAGYICAAAFLPMAASGMHHGLAVLYAVQLETFGYIALYPAFAMAGAGQAGAALAVRSRARKVGNERLCRTIDNAIPAAVLGIGEPLICTVTLPLGRPFVTAGLGAGFGGAFVLFMKVAATAWGVSGLPGVLIMTEGPNGALVSAGCYLAGLAVSCGMGYILTVWNLNDEEIANAEA